MLLRALAVLATLFIPLATAFDGIFTSEAVPIATVLVCVGALLLRRNPALPQVLIAAALAAFATHTAFGTQELLRDSSVFFGPSTIDLRTDPISTDRAGVVEATGYLRDEWVLDEYRTADGQRPDQNKTAHAVLVPFLGDKTESLRPDHPVVVARIPATLDRGQKLQTLTGTLRPIPKELLVTLLAAASPDAEAQMRGLLLDTVDLPTRGQALTRAGLALFAALLAALLLLLGIPSPAPPRPPT